MQNGNVLEKQAREAAANIQTSPIEGSTTRDFVTQPVMLSPSKMARGPSYLSAAPARMTRGPSMLSYREVYGRTAPASLPTTMRRQPTFSQAGDDTMIVDPTAFERSDDIKGVTDGVVDEQTFPNELVRWRYFFREYLAEVLGTMVFLIFGFGADCVNTLSDGAASNPTGVALGWGIGLALGVYISGGISGGHLNPAVTISLLAFRKFPLRKVPGFILAQLLGAMAATLIVFGNYKTAILLLDPGKTTTTSSLFISTPGSFVTPATAFFSEFVGAAILIGVIFAITDSSGNPPPKGMVPIVLQLLLTGLALVWGWETSFSFNPARDFGPRVALAMVGYGSAPFTTFHAYFTWGTIIAPILGGLTGALLYDVMIFTGGESWLNVSTGEWAKQGLVLGRGARAKGPAGVAADDMDI